MTHPSSRLALRALLLPLLLAGSLTACKSDSYTSNLSLSGVDHQRDLTEGVEETLAAHVETQQTFALAFDLVERFTEPGAGVDLDLYDALRHQLDQCATGVRRLDPQLLQLESDGAVLFASWDRELEQFSNPKLRARSEARMLEVEEHFHRLQSQLGGTRAQMEQALVTLRDYVLFFNHNMNPASIASLRDESLGFGDVVESLQVQVETARLQAHDLTAALEGRPGMLSGR